MSYSVIDRQTQRWRPNKQVRYFLYREFDPLQMPGCTGWYDAADTNTITSSSNSVSQWNDKSLSARNVTQATGANQPTTGSMLGPWNSISFDGGDYLTVTGLTVGTGAISMFIVVDNDQTANFGNLMNFRRSTTATPIVTYEGNSTTGMFARRRNDSNTLSTTSSNTTRTPCIGTYWHDGTNLRNRVNGVQVGTTQTSTGNATVDALTIGAGRYAVPGETFTTFGVYLTGLVGEIIIYEAALSLPQISTIENYLRYKWNLY